MLTPYTWDTSLKQREGGTARENMAVSTSLTADGAKAEYRKYLNKAGIHKIGLLKPRELVSLLVAVYPVMDLTNTKTSPISPKETFLTSDDPEDLQTCRELADTIRAQGYAGILAPSAALGGEMNLIIYIDDPSRNVFLDVGPDRIPL